MALIAHQEEDSVVKKTGAESASCCESLDGGGFTYPTMACTLPRVEDLQEDAQMPQLRAPMGSNQNQEQERGSYCTLSSIGNDSHIIRRRDLM